jgi:hypothetical protein
MAVRTTALNAAFIPGASPPLVKTPILFMDFLVIISTFKKVLAFSSQY